MTVGDLVVRVIVQGAAATAACAVIAAWSWSVTVSIGIATGGTVALANFALLARGMGHIAGRPVRARFVVALITRHALCLAALAAPVAAGWAHPVALGLGITLLPIALTIEGFRVSREERGA